VKGLCTPALPLTTSEPPVGNSRPGTPVNASMSDSASCNQGGTVEYDLYPTPELQGVGIFYTFPHNREMLNAKGKMQNCGIRLHP